MQGVRPHLYGENLSQEEWSSSKPSQILRAFILGKKLTFFPEPATLAHALIVSPWPNSPGWAFQEVYMEKFSLLGGWQYHHKKSDPAGRASFCFSCNRFVRKWKVGSPKVHCSSSWRSIVLLGHLFHLIYGAFVLKRRCELGMANTVIVIAMLFLKCNKRMPPLRLRHVLFTITLACLIPSAPRVTLVH